MTKNDPVVKKGSLLLVTIHEMTKQLDVSD